MKTLILVLLGLTSCYTYSVTPEQGLQSSRALLTLFREFQSEAGHEYDPAELSLRIKIFRNTLKNIAEVNSEQNSWEAGLTEFADMTEEEMDQYRGVNASRLTHGGEEDVAVPAQLGSSLDWRDRGHVTPVKSQRGRSCWTFATVTCIEALYKGLTRRLVEFADQELMDCVYPTNDANRNGGGWYHDAFDWIKKSGRLGLRSEAPHTGQDGPCNYGGKTNALAGYSVTGYRNTAKNEAGIISGLAQGPVGVAFRTKGSRIGIYRRGIYRYTICPDTYADHAVAAVGYTRDAIVIKNSWGTNWGENGYLLWARGMAGHNCRMYNHGAYPILSRSAGEEVEE